MSDADGTPTIVLQLTEAEALVFFDWLSRHDESDSLPINDAAEEIVLWRVQGQLEKILIEPLNPNYANAVAAARLTIRGPQD